MNHAQISALENASRSAMAYIPEDEPRTYSRLMLASLAALSILAASAVIIAAIL